MRGLEVADALERRAHVLVVFGALDAVVGLHRKQVQQVHQADLHGLQVHAVDRIENARGLADGHAVALPRDSASARIAGSHRDPVQRHARDARGGLQRRLVAARDALE